jgi:hypothetical protein
MFLAFLPEFFANAAVFTFISYSSSRRIIEKAALGSEKPFTNSRDLQL